MSLLLGLLVCVAALINGSIQVCFVKACDIFTFQPLETKTKIIQHHHTTIVICVFWVESNAGRNAIGSRAEVTISQ